MLTILFSALIVVAALMLMTVLASAAITASGIRHAEKLRMSAIARIESLLPNTSCGACGCKDCHAFAEALADGEESPNRCPACSEEAATELQAVISSCISVSVPLPASLRKRKRKFRAALYGWDKNDGNPSNV